MGKSDIYHVTFTVESDWTVQIWHRNRTSLQSDEESEQRLCDLRKFVFRKILITSFLCEICLSERLLFLLRRRSRWSKAKLLKKRTFKWLFDVGKFKMAPYLPSIDLGHFVVSVLYFLFLLVSDH